MALVTLSKKARGNTAELDVFVLYVFLLSLDGKLKYNMLIQNRSQLLTGPGIPDLNYTYFGSFVKM